MILHKVYHLILFIAAVLVIQCDGAPNITELCSKNSYESLYQLFLDAVNSHKHKNQSEIIITIVTFATSNIASYAAFAFGVNWVYCSMHGYDYLVHSPETGSQYELNDQRWNRVKILHNLLLNDSRPNSYYVWTDADLVITDAQFKFEDILNQYSMADIIISAERHVETGVANTGCFIIRNSQWSRDFLAQWWDSNRGAAHDQIFFDRLYRSLMPGVRDHVAILPTTVLNTVPPAYMPSTTPRFHSVLHLMGETDGLRAAVFQHGWRHLCGQLLPAVGTNNVDSGIGGGVVLRSDSFQLDLSPSVLARVAHDFHSNQARRLTTVLTGGHLPVAQSLSIIAELRQLVLLKGQISSASSESTALETEAALRRMYAVAQSVLAALSLANDTCVDDIAGTCVVHTTAVDSNVTATAADSSAWVDALNTCATVGNDLLQCLEQRNINRSQQVDQEQSVLYAEVEVYLSLLSDAVDTGSRALVAEMRSVLLSNKGDWFARRERLDEAVGCYRRAVEAVAPPESSMFGDNNGVSSTANINPFRWVHPLRSLARGFCLVHGQQQQQSEAQLIRQRDVRVEEAHNNAWRDVTRLYDQLLLHSGDQLREDHFEYASVLAEAVRCVAQHGDGVDVEFRSSLHRLCSVGFSDSAFASHCSALLVSLPPPPQASPPPPVGVSTMEDSSSRVHSAGSVKRMRKKRVPTNAGNC